MSTETDGQLVARTRTGDLTAFEEIVTRHRAALVALAAARTGSLAEAEDVAQEAFVQAFFRLHQLREPEALRAWLGRIASRLALTHLRARREEPMAPAEVGRLHAAGQETREGGVALLLRPLPEAMRRTLTLTYLAGYTCAETAELLGVREGTIKSRLSRARALLKEAFDMAEQELTQGRPDDEFTRQTIERLMREARRLVREGDLEQAANKAGEALAIQTEQYIASEAAPDFAWDMEALRIRALPLTELRRRQAQENAAQYGFRLEELDWQVADVDMMEGTISKPAGHGRDTWGVPFSRLKIRLSDTRDICRHLACSPIQLHAWLQQGLPVVRSWPLARFDLERVRQWLAKHGIVEWEKETPQTTDLPIRVMFRELHRGTITPEQAEQIVHDLGWGWV